MDHEYFIMNLHHLKELGFLGMQAVLDYVFKMYVTLFVSNSELISSEKKINVGTTVKLSLHHVLSWFCFKVVFFSKINDATIY